MASRLDSPFAARHFLTVGLMSSKPLPPDVPLPEDPLSSTQSYQAPSQEITPAVVIGQFALLRLLGQGGMGAVYEAEDTLLRRRVAIKILAKFDPGDQAPLQRLLREARAVALLNHKNVVSIYHIGEWQGGYYLVLELMRGGSLQARISSKGPMPWTEATKAMIDASHGLQAAHAAKLIHRDIKPGNLMCEEPGTVKLTDFGLVRGGEISTPRTMTHMVGTPHYMSPEQCRNEPADERSDIYGLGATYFALLTGRPPYVSESPVQLMFAHCNAPIPNPRELRAEIPEACAAIVVKALAKKPSDRYASVAELLKCLQPLPSHRSSSPDGISPRESGEPTRIWPLLERSAPRANRRFSMIALALLCLTVIGLLSGIVLLVLKRNGRDGGNDSRVSREITELRGAFDPAIPPEGRVIPMGGRVRAVAFSPDARLFAAGIAEKQPGDTAGAIVWELASGKKLHYLWPNHAVLSLLFPIGSNDLIYGGPDGAWIWHFRAGQEDRCFDDGITIITSLAVTRTGSTLAVGGYVSDQSRKSGIGQWEFPGGNTLPNITVGPPIDQILYSPHDGTLAVSCRDGSALLWETQNGAAVPGPRLEPAPRAPALAFAPDRNILAVGSSGKIQFWNCSEKKWNGKEITRQGEINALAFSSDGKFLAVAEDGPDVTIWDVSSATLAHTFKGHTKSVLGLAFSPQAKLLATGSEDRTVRLWDMRLARTK
jgi:serine/threonine protein kinase/WD40 repeat protein